MDDFLIRAGIAGLLVAALAGPLGAFVVWRRMAYFGATLSHSALLGIALGLLMGVAPLFGVVAVGIVVALMLGFGNRGGKAGVLSEDTLLGIMAHGTLAVGLVVISFMDDVRFGLMGYLFGDILAVGTGDLYVLFGGSVVVLLALAVLWRPLLAATVNEELARVEGVPVAAVRIGYMVLLAVTVALAMKIVGILLVTSLLIIPAAAARWHSRTPEQMAVLAALVGGVSVLGGLAASYIVDTPSGPSIVVVALVLFVLARAMATVTR
ncbi:MAG: iron chelate uptake ABC transporter family permease subunit [Rhodospirillaceae bacterium]|nr:iron chelate uptake ABC transporter family permease subunit [Rhodospirillaceae bacterium]MBT4219722.1 iron chelate uptake ABC transporter family permease subunit [Rhodospirillaceae bacterium]MBT4464646.1 iron chelate uptake ABC transporter family permease subunit [Rhodospirillaceae bacterium]MBT5309785.1 iron chelate uptake ABC transporter family permease subunit [Rhodospirillaceae bacterium]MBT7356001.1 iron chelate uptake ABC transporter family permease subunit [Rhodospirillaceae bacterium